jgi:hypothetical protein
VVGLACQNDLRAKPAVGYYDSIDREKLLTVLQAFGIPRKLIKLTGMTMNNTKCKVKVQNTLSEKFKVNRGLRQGDQLSLTLFNPAMEQAVRATRTNAGGTINNRMTQIVPHADDVLLYWFTKYFFFLSRVLK